MRAWRILDRVFPLFNMDELGRPPPERHLSFNAISVEGIRGDYESLDWLHITLTISNCCDVWLYLRAMP